MGITYEDALGERKRLYVAAETTAGTFRRPAATDAMAALTTNMPPNIMRKNRRDSYQASRDTLERITGKSEYSWSIDGYYIPSGTKNVAPECGVLLEAIFGTETINANDVTYSQSSSQVLNTMTIVENYQNWFMQSMWGCMVEQMTLKCAGGDEPKIHFDGRGMGYEPTGYSTLDGNMVATNQMVVQTADARMFGENSVVQIDADDGLNDLGYRISVDTSAPTFTIVNADDDSAASVTESDTDTVTPFTPTWTDAGVPTTGITGSLTWDSLDISAIVTGFELSVKANNAYHDNAAFQQDLSDATPGFFDITGTIDMRLRKDALVKILDRKAFATKALAVVLGGAAQSGTRTEIDLAQCEMEFTNVAVPESGVATISVPFIALGSSGNDAITWKHT